MYDCYRRGRTLVARATRHARRRTTNARVRRRSVHRDASPRGPRDGASCPRPATAHRGFTRRRRTRGDAPPPRASFRPPVRGRGSVGGDARGPQPLRARAVVVRAAASPRPPPRRAARLPRAPRRRLVVVRGNARHRGIAREGGFRAEVPRRRPRRARVLRPRARPGGEKRERRPRARLRDGLGRARARRRRAGHPARGAIRAHRRARHRPRPRRRGHRVAHPGAPEARRRRAALLLG